MGKLLTVDEVADRLRVHPMTVRRQIKSGRLRATRVGRSVRVSEEAVEQMITPYAERRVAMTKNEWMARVLAPPTPEQLAIRKKALGGIQRLRGQMTVEPDALIRAERRGREVTGGEKTWEELIAEESEPVGD